MKELRLGNICDLNTANAFLPQFIEDYNHRFAVSPAHPVDAHRRLKYDDEGLKLILAEHHTRIVSKNLQISYQNILYQIQAHQQAYTLRKANVTVCDHQGEVTLLYKGRKLDFKTFDKGNQPAPIADSKRIQSMTLNKPKMTSKPKAEHPWRKTNPSTKAAKLSIQHAT